MEMRLFSCTYLWLNVANTELLMDNAGLELILLFEINIFP